MFFIPRGEKKNSSNLNKNSYFFIIFMETKTEIRDEKEVKWKYLRNNN